MRDLFFLQRFINVVMPKFNNFHEGKIKRYKKSLNEIVKPEIIFGNELISSYIDEKPMYSYYRIPE